MEQWLGGERYRKLELGSNLDEDGTNSCCQDAARENCEKPRHGATGERQTRTTNCTAGGEVK